jgi:hypothetical protein
MLRHWKQHFDADADLIFLKRMVIRGYGVDIAQPGDRVPQELKEHFGVHRLKIWWEGGFLGIHDAERPCGTPQQDVEVDGATVPETVSAVADGSHSVVHVGGGYYDVTRDGITTRIRGKKNIPS